MFKKDRLIHLGRAVAVNWSMAGVSSAFETIEGAIEAHPATMRFLWDHTLLSFLLEVGGGAITTFPPSAVLIERRPGGVATPLGHVHASYGSSVGGVLDPDVFLSAIFRGLWADVDTGCWLSKLLA